MYGIRYGTMTGQIIKIVLSYKLDNGLSLLKLSQYGDIERP